MVRKPVTIWFTDIHITLQNIPTVYSVVQQIIQLCIANEITGVIIGGDVFHSRLAQPEVVLQAFSTILETFERSGINVVCIPGNHDKTSYIQQSSFLDVYKHHPNLHLIDGYQKVEVSEHNLRFHFIPYFDEKLKYREYLDQAISNITLDVKNILFTHVAISGVKNNDGTKVENDFSTDSFKDFYKVIVGHYHNAQTFKNIVYTGSTHQANYGEDSQKGCTIVYSDGSTKLVKLETPQYNTYRLDQSMLDNLNMNESFDGNNRLKVLFKPNIEQLKKIQQLESKGVKVEYEYESEVLIDKEVKTQFDREDIVTYFTQWCEEEKIEDKEFGLNLL